MEQVLDALSFSAADKQRIENGELVSTDVPDPSERELGALLGFVFKRPLDATVDLFRKGSAYHRDPQVVAYGKIATGTALDFADLRLGVDGGAEAQAFLNARPGEALNLSSAEVAAFSALKAQQPNAAEVQPRVEAQLRTLLAARYAAYRSGGLPAIAPYDRGGGKVLSPGEELKEATVQAKVLGTFAPAVQQVMLGYPRVKPPQLEERFFWVVYRIDDRPTLALSHRLWVKNPDYTIVVDRLYYVSRSFNAEQALGGFFPVGNGTAVIYSSRTYTDQVSGLGSSVKRAIGDHMVANQLSAAFRKLAAER